MDARVRSAPRSSPLREQPVRPPHAEPLRRRGSGWRSFRGLAVRPGPWPRPGADHLRMDVVGRAALRRLRRGQPAVRPFRPVRALPRNGRAAQDPAGSSRRSQARPRARRARHCGQGGAVGGGGARGHRGHRAVPVRDDLHRIRPVEALRLVPHRSHRAAHAAGRALCVHHRAPAGGRHRRAGLCGGTAASRLQRAPSCYTESFRHGSSKGDAG